MKKYIILLFTIILIGCSIYIQNPLLTERYLPVPLVTQQTNYSCGPASLLSVLYYWQVYTGDEQSLYGALGTTPENGTHPFKIIEVAKKMGLDSYFIDRLTINDLQYYLEQRITVILDLQAWSKLSPEKNKQPWEDTWEDGHYVVLIGLDNENVYIMDPSTHGYYAYVPIKELMVRWHDYEINPNGTIWKNYQLGIIIIGTNPVTTINNPKYFKRMY